MAEAFIVRRGGGGSGGTLVVTSAGAGTVTVSNSTLGKSYSKTVTAGGSVIFKGLKTGTWTVKLSNGTQTSTKTVNVTADYSTSIAYFSATISVTYPAGSTCAITTDPTNHSDAIFAGDTSGHWSFTVPYAGNWIVASYTGDISNPDKIAYEAVDITTNGQSENVTLAYELVLYSAGDEHTAITGGWVSKRACTLTKNADNLYVVATETYSANRGVFATANKIDLSPYSRLYYNAKNGTSQSGYFGIGVWASIPALGTDPITSAAAYIQFGSAASAESSIDVSSLSGEYYVGGQVTKGDNITGSGYIYEMKLLPEEG